MDIKEERKECFNCDCSQFSHTFVINYWNWEDKEDIQLEMDVGLIKTTFWFRVWTAVKYIFKFDESYKWGHSNIIIQDNDIPKLIKFLNKYLEEKDI
jgi:hypothetical protein